MGQMIRPVIYISLFLVLFLTSNAIGVTLSYSDNVSGSGSFRKDYKILNERNDFSKVNVDLKNAVNYEYGYSTYSDEIQSRASEYLIVDHAESIICSGEAKNRNNISTKITTSVYNGNITFDNSVKASNKGVQAYQNITDASGDRITIEGEALGNDGKALDNRIISEKCEHFRSTQKLSLGEETYIGTNISAITGPMNVTSIASNGKKTLKTTADAVAGVIDINQTVNLTTAYQDSMGVAGPVVFNASIENMNRSINQVYLTTGSGNLITLVQKASEKDIYYTLEYEYMPISYQTGTYDEAYVSGGSYLRSDKEMKSILKAPNCEHLQIHHEADMGKNARVITSLNAIAGPVNVVSYTEEANRTVATIAEVAAGVMSIDQRVDLREAYQSSKGVTGGVKFFSTIENGDRNKNYTFAASGSGNLIALTQDISGQNSFNSMDFEYMPVSYRTGVYDANYFHAKSWCMGDIAVGTQLNVDSCEKARLNTTIDGGESPKIHQELNAKVVSERINWSTTVDNKFSDIGCEYYEQINGAIGSSVYANRMPNVAKIRNFTSCDPSMIKKDKWVEESFFSPDLFSESTWNRKWSLNQSGGYSSSNELINFQGTFLLDETLGIKKMDCRWRNVLKKT